ncbi:DUF6285 domain-containing protein [Antrihabitans sp. YC2-6]|uniref:DUF6285 domain-containing protein n=1 Tax=Antrihabitans sp. YC2-6 TaxID=2799498 RepID=UPI0018F3B165|nr:DUF6285 domain-containing protein [Antrihabitans sp. YC2-6]MBJ8348812.1 hypothetical protein [Antrihabitans sp. YC2-6]
MQYRPTASELLATLAELLEDTLLPALPPSLQHQARVGANLARIVQREVELRAESAKRESDVLAALPEGDERAEWEALVAVVRGDLAIAKPGYDEWEAE